MHLKRLKFDQSITKTEEQKNRITDPLAFFQMFPTFMKDVYTSKFIAILFYVFPIKISKNQCDFRKGFNTQHILLAMIEKMKESRDNKKFCATIQTSQRHLIVFVTTC